MKKVLASVLASAMIFAVPAFASEEVTSQDEPMLISTLEDSSAAKLYGDYINTKPGDFLGNFKGIIVTDLIEGGTPEIISYLVSDAGKEYGVDSILYIEDGVVKEVDYIIQSTYVNELLPEKNASTAAGIFQHGEDRVFVNFASQCKIYLSEKNGDYGINVTDDLRKMVGKLNYDDLYYKKYRRLNVPVFNECHIQNIESVIELVTEYEAALEKSQEVRTSEWAAEDIKRAQELGLIPDELKDKNLVMSATREEFTAIIMGLFNKISEEELKVNETLFKDIDKSTYKEEIELASTLGVTTGTSLYAGYETFSPNDLIERQDAATMLCRLYKKLKFNDWSLENDGEFSVMPEVSEYYKDHESIADYAKESVYFMTEKGVVEGLREDFFEPVFKKITGEGLASREEAIVMALNAYEKLFAPENTEVTDN